MPNNQWSDSSDKGATGAAKFVTSTLGNTVGGLSSTVGGVAGSTGKPVGDALGSAGTGLEDGLRNDTLAWDEMVFLGLGFYVMSL
ncbi:uncharacterized protein BDV17DRAFT_286748 [Aspergillus undulatus]|uniref:uncharacterized protein n=1 Tax=Aspergillus undulatus TaxID=1810928 RepID=UPI003CCD22DA